MAGTYYCGDRLRPDARAVLSAYAGAAKDDTVRVRTFCQSMEDRLAADLSGNIFAKGLVQKCDELGYLFPRMPKAAFRSAWMPAAWECRLERCPARP